MVLVARAWARVASVSPRAYRDTGLLCGYCAIARLLQDL